jgi:lycopene cyclase CruP
MSVKVGQNVNPKFVNRLLAVNFEIMDNMGERTFKPFLQDVVRFDGLVGSLGRAFVADPLFMPEIVAHVGLPRLVDWLGHLSMMALYTALDTTVSPLLQPIAKSTKDPRKRFALKRQMEAWKFGSGGDYKF